MINDIKSKISEKKPSSNSVEHANDKDISDLELPIEAHNSYKSD